MTKSLDIARELKAEGYREVRHGKGRHRIFKHPAFGTIAVPDNPGGRSLHPGLACWIRCQIKQAKRGQKRWKRDGDETREPQILEQ